MARDGPEAPPDALKHIHATASRSDSLTTFGDLTAPPPATSAGESKGIEFVPGGLSSLYSRLRASVGAAKEGTAESHHDSAVQRKANRDSGHASQPSIGTAVSSPALASSSSTSMLQSPSAATFSDPQALSSRESVLTGSTMPFRQSFSASRTSLSTATSRHSRADSLEQPHEAPNLVVSPTLPHPRGPGNAPVEQAFQPGDTRTSLDPSLGRDEPFRSQRDDEGPVGEESDTTEDDLVMVDSGGFANDNAHAVMTPNLASEGLSKQKPHVDGSLTDLPLALRSPLDQPAKASLGTDVSHVMANAQTTVLSPAPQRPAMIHIGPSHLPGFLTSRASSSDGLSSVLTSTTVRNPAVAPIDELKQQTSGVAPASTLPTNYLSQMRRKILDREFWMRDENAKDCFNCGDAFSTFRRKHHCRTCGQIFDSKCTSLVSGKMFGQSGNLRVCKPCEAIIYGHDDDSSVYTDDGDQASIYEQGDLELADFDPSESDHTKIGTPTISIPISRKPGSEKKRRSTIIEVAAPTLARPSSSRSLRSLGGRPRSSSHKRHNSRHQHMRTVKYDERAPFHQSNLDVTRSRSALPAFHHDNIIDPDLAPFMSDDDSSEDEQASIFATLESDSPSHVGMDGERGGLGGLLSVMRKGTKPRPGDRSIASVRDTDNISVTSRHVPRRRRNLSVSSITHGRPSPRRTKSNSLLRAFGATLGVSGALENPAISSAQISTTMPLAASRVTRSASMQGTNTPTIELNQASRQHIRMLLKQMLQDAAIPHASKWERALMPILLQCTDDVNPDVQRSDDMDIRHYIKLKKIPGGTPKDTSYVSGVVFTKQLERKDMPRCIPNPRIIIVTFAIEYARHQAHFIQLDRVVAQEREYLRNLVGRIAHLQPHILLVQRNVSGLALEFLQEAGIVVASNVKETVLNAVSRCTGAPMISSVDKLAIDRDCLGQCESFDVKTFVYGNTRKTYIFFSGCQPDLGCTIVLRGAGTQVLRRLKRITEFLCYVVYNLKLETCLMRDESIDIPLSSIGGTLASNSPKERQDETKTRDCTDDDSDRKAPDLQGTSNASPSSMEQTQGHGLIPSFYSDMVEKHRTTILSSSPFVRFMQPYLLNQAREYERKLGYLKRLRDQYIDADGEKEESPQSFELIQPEMVHNRLDRASNQVREFLHAVHASEYDRALHNYQTQKRHWEAFLSGNMDIYNPFNHQKIATLYSVVNSSTSTPCVGPEIIALGFYHEHDYDDGFTPDCTLGQYVEDLIHSARIMCGNDGCNKRLLEHHRQYVHGDGQISVHVITYPAKLKSMQNTILMWSSCRKCCLETQVMPMSPNTWKYSFAKFLELTFWSTELRPRNSSCTHDIHRDHVRFFGLNNLALRIQYDPVPLYEVIVPRPVITWKVDSDLRLKNELFLNIEERLDLFTASVRARLDCICAENVLTEKVEACRAEVKKLTDRVNEEHEWLKRKLQDKYMTSKYYEIIPLNRAIRAIQEKAIAWDITFAEFEEEFFPSEKDIKRLAALQLKKIFLEREETTNPLESVTEGVEPTEDEAALDEKGEPLPMTPMSSAMSPERTRDMLNSVVKEDQTHGSRHGTVSKFLRPPTPDCQELSIQKALESEDVRHLDLALPSHVSENAPVKEPQTPRASPEGDAQPAPGSPIASALPKIEPVGQSVVEAIENMPASPTPQHIISSGTLESKIPRLVDAIRREAGGRPAAVVRTQSQPGGIPKLQTQTSLTPREGSGSSGSSSTDSLKLNLSDSARAHEKRMSERLISGTFRQAKQSSMIPIPRSVPGRGPKEPTRVSALAKHFEQLQREFEKERRRERLQHQKQNRYARAYPLASSKPVVEVYNDVHEAVQEHGPSDEEVRASLDNSTLEESAYTETTHGTTTVDASPVEERHLHKNMNTPTLDNDDDSGSPNHPASDIENEGSDLDIGPEDIPLPDSVSGSHLLEGSLELPKHEKTTLMKMLTSFWSERSASGWTALKYPLGQFEHVWEDSDIIVREDEPSSIIALALSSPDYVTKLQSFRDDPTIAPNGVGGLEGSEASIERNLLHEANTNIRYSFTNRGVKAQCKIFYAQSFDALRRKCGVADRFVESLSRCSKWDSKGGKSKSIFLKTLDERFVLKSLSPVEVNAFFRFAPNYFAFTHQNLFKGLPSVIAKMFGLFQVTIKTSNGRDFDWFMLVMENLFYEREPNRRYDLKGSMRNRKVQSTGERDEVLLDENLVDIIYSETPIFVREHTKKLLKASVWNDTLFLQQQNVMDYSLMAGFHDESREIIVGIIDCIRTYTWDKKLESWIKDRGKNKPTITSPKDYRNRFRMAMEKYILQAPNCWHQFSGRVVGVGIPKRGMAVPPAEINGSASTRDSSTTCQEGKREA